MATIAGRGGVPVSLPVEKHLGLPFWSVPPAFRSPL